MITLESLTDTIKQATTNIFRRAGETPTGDLVVDALRAMELEAAFKKEREAAQAQAEFEKAKVKAKDFLNPEFKEEVINELMEEGCTLLQAQGRTRDQFHLHKEAVRLGLI
jgi:hypothetical protein